MFGGDGKVKLDFGWNDARKELQVIIPKKEQYKIPINRDIKIIFSIPWINYEYEDIYPDQKSFIFQSAKMTINFKKEGSVLMPSLEVKDPVVLQGEKAVIDASRTYITFRPEAKK